jgi:hypothetical protein
VNPRGGLVQHHIGAFHADRPAELAQHLVQPCPGFRRAAIDQPCRILREHALECGAPSESKGTGAQPQAEIHQRHKQQQRNEIQHQPEALRRCGDGRLVKGEQGTDLFAGLPARHGDQGLQRFVDRGQEALQQAGMREEGAGVVRIGPGVGRKRCKAFDPVLERLFGVRGYVARQVEDRCCQRAGRGCELRIARVERRACAQQADIGQRILQERVVRLEPLRQFLLLDNRCGQPLGRPRVEAFCLRVGAQPGDRVLDDL